MDLALNNLQWLICHETQHNNKPIKSPSGVIANMLDYELELQSYYRTDILVKSMSFLIHVIMG